MGLVFVEQDSTCSRFLRLFQALEPRYVFLDDNQHNSHMMQEMVNLEL